MILERFPAPAVNCYTGSLIRMAYLHGTDLDEAELLERGDGYLLCAGHDELGYPEYTFAVEEVGMRGIGALGHDVRTKPIEQCWREQLRALVREHKGVVAWTNSAHLAYAGIYATNPGYLHAILVHEMSDDLQQVRVYDSLVVDTERFGCDAWLSAEAFGMAITDRVAAESHDHMGFFHIFPAAASDGDQGLACVDLGRQAMRFMADARYHGSVAEYRQLCTEFFRHGDDNAKCAARRLFDHINVLYVLPNLRLLERSLGHAKAGAEAEKQCYALTEYWKVLSLQALKFEATLSASVLTRIEDQFKKIEDATASLWGAVQATLCEEVPDERTRARTRSGLARLPAPL
jgi:hypothetical protein